MTDCARGCTEQNQHVTDCLCTAECPDHRDHCDGCLPVDAQIGNYCQPCAGKWRDALDDLTNLIPLVAGMPEGRLSTGGRDTATAWRQASGTRHPSLSPALDEADEAMWWLYSWAETLADQLQHAGPFRYTEAGIPVAREVTTHAQYLRAHADAALSADFHEDLYTETLAWRKRLERATGSDRLTHRIRERCPSCNQRTLLRDDGAGKVICANRDCNRVWYEGEYDWFAHVAAS